MEQSEDVRSVTQTDKVCYASQVLKRDGFIEIGVFNNKMTQAFQVDRATAARLINQLRRALDD